MREKLMEILTELRPDIDFEMEDQLVSGGLLESFDIVALVSELNDAFDIEIGRKDLTADNFDSVEAIEELITSLEDN